LPERLTARVGMSRRNDEVAGFGQRPRQKRRLPATRAEPMREDDEGSGGASGWAPDIDMTATEFGDHEVRLCLLLRVSKQAVSSIDRRLIHSVPGGHVKRDRAYDSERQTHVRHVRRGISDRRYRDAPDATPMVAPTSQYSTLVAAGRSILTSHQSKP
jgi:hypothetical protein